MKKYDNLIFVSGGDTAIGPMAEAIMSSKYLLEELSVCSKGIVVLFPEPINPKAEAILMSHGLTMKKHMSEPFGEQDLGMRTLLLAVNEEAKQKLQNTFPNAAEYPLFSLREFVGEEEDVTDPYGGNLAEYGLCFEQLEKMISRLVIQLNEEELLC